MGRTAGAAFHAARCVHGVPEETVPGHGQPNDAGHAWAAVQTDAQANALLRHVRDGKGGQRADQLQRP